MDIVARLRQFLSAFFVLAAVLWTKKKKKQILVKEHKKQKINIEYHEKFTRQ